MQDPRGGLRGGGRGAGALQEAVAQGSDARRRAAPHGVEVHPHLAVRFGEGRQRDQGDRGRDRARALRSGSSDRLRRGLLRTHPREVRQGPRAAHRIAVVRYDRGGEGGRHERQAVRRPRRGILRHRQVDEGRRVRVRLFGHRRRDRLYEGRPLHYHQGERQGLLRQEYLLHRRLQAQRRADDLQRPLPRRQERPDPDEALRDQGHHARQGVRHHEGNAPKRNPLHDGQPQRRGRGAESLLQARATSFRATASTRS